MTTRAKQPAWRCVPALAEFERFADSWDVLNHRFMQAHPLGNASFVRSLVKHFANERDFLAVQPSGGEYRGMLLLRMDRFGVVRTFRPAQTEICPVLIDSIEDVQSLFAVLPRSTLALQLECQDPDYCVTSPSSSSLIIEIDQHATTVTIDIDGEFDEYWINRPAKLQQNIGRSQRNLEQNKVNWNFKTVESPHDIASAVGRYGDLESKGWKRKSGTAVHSTNTQGQFYREILRDFAARGKSVVYELYFRDSLVSSQLAIGNDSVLITLKTTYDEQFSKYSPGKLLDYLTLQHEFALGRFSKVEFCTKAGPDLMRWASRTRAVNHITVYRNKLAWRLVRMYTGLKSIGARRPRVQGDRCQTQEAFNGE